MAISKTTRLVADIVTFVLTKYVTVLASGTRSFVLARWLGPADFGLWSTYQLVLKYADNSHLGLRHAVNREVPIARGRGESEAAARIESVSFAWILTFGSAAALLVVAATLFLPSGPATLIYGLWITAAIVLLAQVDSFFMTLLRVNHEFRLFSQMILLMEVASLAGVAIAIPLLGVTGAIGALAAAYAGLAGYFWLRKPELVQRLTARRSLSLPHLRRLMAVGLPIVAFGYLSILATTLDRLLVLWLLDRSAFGLYSLAATIVSLIAMLPGNVGYVLFPCLGEELGAERLENLRQYVVDPTFIMAGLTAPLVGIATVCLPSAVGALLPQYLPVLPAMRILLLGSFFTVLAGVSSYLLVTMTRYWQYGACLAGAAALNGVVGYLLLRQGSGLTGVAVGAAVGYAFSGCLNFSLALRALGVDPSEARRLLLGHVAPWVYNVALLWAAGWALSGGGWLLSTTAGTPWADGLTAALLLLLNMPILAAVNRRGGLAARFRSVLSRA